MKVKINEKKLVKFNLYMSCVLLVAFVLMLVATTVAYFSDTQKMTNTFTSGNVKLMLSEAAVKPDANGNLTLTAPDSGRYELTVSKDGFITAGFDITVEDGQTELTKTLQISPEMRSGEIRLVLTWDENPRDIDSHLVGTSSGGRNVNVMWQNKRSYDENGNVIAELDVDDTTSFGPETTTIHDVGGSYEYYIHKFAGDGTVGSSGAVVKIYNNGRVSVTNCAR